jgi:hypothetical protein
MQLSYTAEDAAKLCQTLKNTFPEVYADDEDGDLILFDKPQRLRSRSSTATFPCRTQADLSCRSASAARPESSSIKAFSPQRLRLMYSPRWPRPYRHPVLWEWRARYP